MAEWLRRARARDVLDGHDVCVGIALKAPSPVARARRLSSVVAHSMPPRRDKQATVERQPASRG
jgi:hypothetical protein